MARIKLVIATQNSYNNLSRKDKTIYICTDTHNIYFCIDLIFSENEFMKVEIGDDDTIVITGYGVNGVSTISLDDYRTPDEIAEAIDGIVQSSFKPSGDILSSDITADLLIPENFGNVYNVIYDFEVGDGPGQISSDLFVESANGLRYSAGTNIAVINIGTSEDPVYKFDIISGGIIDSETIYNIKSDWDSAPGSPSEILNKPPIKRGTGNLSIVEGNITNNLSSGNYSHSEGNGTQSLNDSEHSEGSYNKSNTGTRHSIGIGTENNNRLNALEVMTSGSVYIKEIGGYDGTNPDNSDTVQDVISSKSDKSSTVSSVVYDSENKKMTKTINGDTTDIVTINTIKTDLSLTKNDVGLGNLTNDTQVKLSEMGIPGGVATLNSSGKVPDNQLPSNLDDVIEVFARSGQTELSSTWFAIGSASGEVVIPETSIIYILMNSTANYSTNDLFRWETNTYVQINDTEDIIPITTSDIDLICSNSA